MSDVAELLQRLAEKQQGPLPTFTSTQILGVILYLGRVGRVGRKRLSMELGIGEGAVRNILGRLKASGLVEVERGGCRLSPEGERLYSTLSETIVEVGDPGAELPWEYPHNYMVVVRGRAGRVRRGLEQRDAAIRAGAEAVMVLTYHNGCLYMPGVANLTEERPEFSSKIVGRARPMEGDVIIITGAWSVVDARNGSIAAAQTLL